MRSWRDLGEGAAGPRLDVGHLRLRARDLRLRRHQRAVLLGDLLRQAIEVAVALRQRRLRALDLGRQLRRLRQLGAQLIQLGRALGQLGGTLGELVLQLRDACALGARVVDRDARLGERRARLLQLVLELGDPLGGAARLLDGLSRPRPASRRAPRSAPSRSRARPARLSARR